MAIIDLDNSGVKIETNDAVERKYARWKKLHEYGPFLIRLVPTGINTCVEIEQESSGSKLDLTDYDNI